LIGQFLLAFRETLEAALVVSIVLAYLVRTKRATLTRFVWYGAGLAVVSSLVFGGLIWFVYGGLVGAAKPLFEGVAALFAVLVLSSMIYWMASKGREFRGEIERQVEEIATQGRVFALTSFAFVMVFREGLETVLFLAPFLEDVAGTISGASLGIVAALVLAYAVYGIGMRVNIRRFFYFTSVLLVLLAGGLAGYGVHELVEYFEVVGVELGWLGEYAYVLNIPETSLFHHKGLFGSVLAVMFGYSVKAEWIRVIVHVAYLVVVLPLVVWVYRRDVGGPEFSAAVSRVETIVRSFLAVS
jgi:high-affinity iron transporter